MATPEQLTMARRVCAKKASGERAINAFMGGRCDNTMEMRCALAAIIETTELAAKHATAFLVGDPSNGIPLRNPMPREIATALRKGDFLK